MTRLKQAYLSIGILEFGWRGLGYRFARQHWDEIKPNVWYPIWALYLGPVNVKWMRCEYDTAQTAEGGKSDD